MGNCECPWSFALSCIPESQILAAHRGWVPDEKHGREPAPNLRSPGVATPGAGEGQDLTQRAPRRRGGPPRIGSLGEPLRFSASFAVKLLYRPSRQNDGFRWRSTAPCASGRVLIGFDRREVGGDFAAAGHQVEIGLETEPEAFRQAEETGEAQVGVGGHGALAQHDLIDPAGRHLDGSGEPVLAEAHRPDELFQKNLTWRRVRNMVSGNRRFRHRSALLQSSGNRCATDH